MELSPAERRILRIIAQNIILSPQVLDGDVIDPGTGKRVVPDATAKRLIQLGLVAWDWSEEYQEYRMVLTQDGFREGGIESA